MPSTKKTKSGKAGNRIGYVELTVRYAVDLDDKDMIQEAKDCIYDDVTNMVKYDETGSWINVGRRNPKLTRADIPDFLLEEAEACRQQEEDDGNV